MTDKSTSVSVFFVHVHSRWTSTFRTVYTLLKSENLNFYMFCSLQRMLLAFRKVAMMLSERKW